MMKKISMYVVTHKKVDKKFDDNIYKFIQVGKSVDDASINEVKDNTGDNISKKNSNYCELTAMYWIWKNDKKSDIVGITHYRRFFSKNSLDSIKKKPIEKKEINMILNKFDIIVPEPLIMRKGTVFKQYSDSHFANDLYITRQVISEIYPEYLDSFDNVMNRNYYSACNMIICNKHIYDYYMKWLFDILFEVEKRVDISNYDAYNKRIFGFISERLLNVWLNANRQYSIKELPIYNTENHDDGIISIIKYKIKSILKR